MYITFLHYLIFMYEYMRNVCFMISLWMDQTLWNKIFQWKSCWKLECLRCWNSTFRSMILYAVELNEAKSVNSLNVSRAASLLPSTCLTWTLWFIRFVPEVCHTSNSSVRTSSTYKSNLQFNSTHRDILYSLVSGEATLLPSGGPLSLFTHIDIQYTRTYLFCF